VSIRFKRRRTSSLRNGSYRTSHARGPPTKSVGMSTPSRESRPLNCRPWPSVLGMYKIVHNRSAIKQRISDQADKLRPTCSVYRTKRATSFRQRSITTGVIQTASTQWNTFAHAHSGSQVYQAATVASRIMRSGSTLAAAIPTRHRLRRTCRQRQGVRFKAPHALDR
jgi:hypothetical protein